jgi:hypothetical protein
MQVKSFKFTAGQVNAEGPDDRVNTWLKEHEEAGFVVKGPEVVAYNGYLILVFSYEPGPNTFQPV